MTLHKPMRLSVCAALLLSLLAAGCQGRATPAATDPKALEKEGERLRKEHQKEMFNKS